MCHSIGREFHVFQMSTEGSAPCDVGRRYATWINPFAHPIYVIGWRVIPLVSMGGLVDMQWGIVHFWGGTADEQRLIDCGSWDHYMEPARDQSFDTWASPHFRTIWPGQGVQIYTRCAPMPGTATDPRSELVVLIRFTVEQP